LRPVSFVVARTPLLLLLTLLANSILTAALEPILEGLLAPAFDCAPRSRDELRKTGCSIRKEHKDHCAIRRMSC